MMPATTSAKRISLRIAKVLVLVLLAVSPRALLGPKTVFDRAVESKRPKSPKNVVRTNPIRISNLEKQGQSPKPPRPDSLRQDAAGLSFPSPGIQVLPGKAFAQLTKPDYLKSSSASPPYAPLGPPL